MTKLLNGFLKFFLAATLALVAASAFAELKLGTYNIRNFDYDERSHTPTNKEKLTGLIKSMNPDLMAVQEINRVGVFKDYIQKEFFGRYQAVLTKCGGGGDQKLGFVYDPSKLKLLSFDMDMRVSNPFAQYQASCDLGSRPLAVATFIIRETGETFTAVAVHLKAGGQDRAVGKRLKQLQLISELIQEKKRQGQKNFVVMGDFNSTRYFHGGKGKRDFVDMVRKMGLVDLSEKLSCTSYWWGGRPDGRQYPSHLDHILISPRFRNALRAKAAANGHCARLACAPAYEGHMGVSFDEVSDHCPVSAAI